MTGETVAALGVIGGAAVTAVGGIVVAAIGARHSRRGAQTGDAVLELVRGQGETLRDVQQAITDHLADHTRGDTCPAGLHVQQRPGLVAANVRKSR